MKSIKRVFSVVCLMTVVWAGVSAAPTFKDLNASDTMVYRGRAAKYTMFLTGAGYSETRFSRNNNYWLLRPYDEELEHGFVYDLVHQKFAPIDDSKPVEYLDDNNYVTSMYAYQNGQKKDAYMDNAALFMRAEGLMSGFSVEFADSLCRTVSAFVYLDDGSYDHILMDIESGKIIDSVPHHYPDYVHAGLGTNVWYTSNNFEVFPTRSSAPFAFSNFSPVFWDRVIDKTYFIGNEYDTLTPREDRYDTDGTLYGCNNDGSVIIGDMSERAVYVKYNRAGQNFTVYKIPLGIGFEINYAWDVSESGYIVGADQVSTQDPYSRRMFLYDINREEKYYMDEYFENLYGLTFPSEFPLFTMGSISDNGRVIGGYTYNDGAWIPCFISLDEHPLHATVRKNSIRQLYGTANVQLNWEAPFHSEYELTGYNIYRDNVKINPSLLPVTQLTYTDMNVDSGSYNYYIETVYADGQTAKTEAMNQFVVPIGGCLPIQKISYDITYNRMVNLRWSIPSSVAPGNTKSYIPEDGLDMIDLFDTKSQASSVGVQVGDYYYVGMYTDSKMMIYDAYTHERKAEVHIDGITGIYDMAYHNKTFYIVSHNSKVTYVTLGNDAEGNPFRLTRSDQWDAKCYKDQAVHIAYVENDDPDYNDGEDYLILGYYDEMKFYPIHPIDQDDVLPEKEFDIELPNVTISGSAAYKGILYLGDQEGKNRMDVLALDLKTGELLSRTDIYRNPELVEAAHKFGGAMGGLCVSVKEDGTVALECVAQLLDNYYHLVSLEIESAPSVLGYDLFRDGVKLNTDYIKGRHYQDIIDEPGTYVYTVRYNTTNCFSMAKNPVEVTIYEKGTCNGPESLNVTESNQTACLTWDLQETGTNAGLVGFNIYRNGQMIAEEVLDFKYQDPEIEKGVKYVYRVESYYENSCAASDSIEITPTFEGLAMAPSAFRVEPASQNNKVYAAAQWNLPYFEEPLSMGYCSQPVGQTGLEGSISYSLIGWDAADMEAFKDLYLVGVEFVLGDNFSEVRGVVYVDDEMVYNKKSSERFQIGKWNRIIFDEVFSMQQEQEIAVGFSVTFNPELVQFGHLVYDFGPGRRGYSDICSNDGYTVYYLCDKINANLCVRALVVRQRDLEEAKHSADPEQYLLGKIQRVGYGEFTPTVPFAYDKPKVTSDRYTLKGFNIYRDAKKLNDALLTGFSYNDFDVETYHEYEYVVSAVYEDEEKESEPYFLQIGGVDNEQQAAVKALGLYPNPTTGAVCIKGEYASLSVMDLSGRLVMNDVKGKKQISMAGLPNGVYFFRFVMPDGQAHMIKVVKK